MILHGRFRLRNFAVRQNAAQIVIKGNLLFRLLLVSLDHPIDKMHAGKGALESELANALRARFRFKGLYKGGKLGGITPLLRQGLLRFIRGSRAA